jgi:hypothetical protein
MKRALFVILVFLQCVGINRKSEKFDIELLISKWQWVRTSGGFGGVSIAPESEGYTKTIEFKEGGEYFEYKNDSLELLGAYSYIEQEAVLILRGERYMTFRISLAGDTL